MNDDQILDLPIDDEESEKQVLKNLAGGGKRFANFIVDNITFYGAIMILTLVANEVFLEYPLLFYWFWFAYYWGMEALTGKTVGKFITRTRVVKLDGSRPSGVNILGRTLCRIIPFEAFSFLGTPGKGWHDSIPKIYVINE